MVLLAPPPAFVGAVAPAALQLGDPSRLVLLGLLAVLVLPVITVLFVSYLVGNETIDERRVRRLEDDIAALKDAVGIDDADTHATGTDVGNPGDADRSTTDGGDDVSTSGGDAKSE